MKLIDGLEQYKQDVDSWKLTLEIEASMPRILSLLGHFGKSPSDFALQEVFDYLITIEKWKAMCLRERMGNAAKTPKHLIWSAFSEAINSHRDEEALLSIMQLRGFGASVDEDTGQRRAKVATAVLRFLMPIDWGVVDWRNIAILTQLEKTNGIVDDAINRAKKFEARDLRESLDLIDEKAAIEIVHRYREMRTEFPLSRTADIDMALFGLSLIVWPFHTSAPPTS